MIQILSAALGMARCKRRSTAVLITCFLPSFFVELVVLTGAESELGQATTKALLDTGDYHVIGGVKDMNGFDATDDFTPLPCDLNSLDSVNEFCDQVQEVTLGKPLDRLVCHASEEYYRDGGSSDGEAQYSQDGHEQTIQSNFLSPFLMTGRLLADMEDSADARLTLVCPSTNSNGRISNLRDLKGFESGFKNVAMVDGSTNFDSKKSIEDAKLCQKLLTNFLHEKYHKLNHVSFNDYEPHNQKGQEDMGLFKVIHDPASAGKSGVSWKLDGDAITECTDDFDKCYDIDTAYKLFHLAQDVTDAQWPKIKVVTSPCPTLKVIGAVTKAQVQKQELKRMRELGRPGISEPEVVERVSKRQKVAAVLDKVVSFVLKNTLQRAGKLVSSQVLGEFPEEALTGSFDQVSEEDLLELDAEIFSQISREEAKTKLIISCLIPLLHQ